MSSLPESIEALIEEFTRLPGIGRKTAQQDIGERFSGRIAACGDVIHLVGHCVLGTLNVFYQKEQHTRSYRASLVLFSCRDKQPASFGEKHDTSIKIDFKLTLQNQACMCFHTPVWLDKLLRMFKQAHLFIAAAIYFKAQTGRRVLPIHRLEQDLASFRFHETIYPALPFLAGSPCQQPQTTFPFSQSTR